MTTFIEMSISAALLIAAILMLRVLAMGRLPKEAFVVLWMVAVIRLLIPFTLTSPFSFEWLLSGAQASLGLSTANIVAPGVGGSKILPLLLVAIWIGGAIILFVFFGMAHLRCLREYRAALPVLNDDIGEWEQRYPMRRRVQIRQSDRISTPITYGIWKPVVLLPKKLDLNNPTELMYVLAHEYTHIRRFDVLKKWLLLLALSAHWFNPLVWILFILANRDIELSCDESVVRQFGEASKSSYALALIGFEEKRYRIAHGYSGFAKNAIEARIQAIMKLRKLPKASVVLAILIVLAMALVFSTSADKKAFNNAIFSGVYGPGEMEPSGDMRTIDAPVDRA